MNSEQSEFLSWKIAPARLDTRQAAWFLGFRIHEIPILVASGLLRPLGHPARNSTKYFATGVLEALRRDEKWLARATDAVLGHWRQRNGRRNLICDRSRNSGRSTTEPAPRRVTAVTEPPKARLETE